MQALSFHQYSLVDLIGYSSHCGFLLIPNLKSESSIFGALRAQDHEPNIKYSDNRIEIRKKNFSKNQAYDFPNYNFNPKKILIPLSISISKVVTFLEFTLQK